MTGRDGAGRPPPQLTPQGTGIRATRTDRTDRLGVGPAVRQKPAMVGRWRGGVHGGQSLFLMKNCRDATRHFVAVVVSCSTWLSANQALVVMSCILIHHVFLFTVCFIPFYPLFSFSKSQASDVQKLGKTTG